MVWEGRKEEGREYIIKLANYDGRREKERKKRVTWDRMQSHQTTNKQWARRLVREQGEE